MATYFTADTHFGHAPILRQRGRLFATIEAHDDALVAAWNATVEANDDVWHVGDFAGDTSRAACADIFGRLKGMKRLVRGNHDTNRVLELPWVDLPVQCARLTVRDAAGKEVGLFLSHYAHRAWPGLWRGVRHLFGHSHGKLADTRRSCDVGVDAWDFRPIRLEAILARQDACELLPEDFDPARH